MGNGQSAEGEGEPPGAGGAGPLPDAEAAAAALASIGGGVAALEGCLVRPAAARWAAEEAWRRAAGERLRQAEAAAERRWRAVEERLRCVADESWRRVALAEERARDANDAVARLQERVEELEETVRRLTGGGGGAEKDEASLERAAAITNGLAARGEEPGASAGAGGEAMQDFERARLLAYGGGLLLADDAPKALDAGLHADLEARMQALEASLAKALGVLFPRVDALLYKLERRRGLQQGLGPQEEEEEEKDAAAAPAPSPSPTPSPPPESSSPSPPPSAPPRPRHRAQPTPQEPPQRARVHAAARGVAARPPGVRGAVGGRRRRGLRGARRHGLDAAAPGGDARPRGHGAGAAGARRLAPRQEHLGQAARRRGALRAAAPPAAAAPPPPPAAAPAAHAAPPAPPAAGAAARQAVTDTSKFHHNGIISLSTPESSYTCTKQINACASFFYSTDHKVISDFSFIGVKRRIHAATS